MLNLCPGCARTVGDGDEICPHCQRDFRLPSRPPARISRPSKTAPRAVKKAEISAVARRGGLRPVLLILAAALIFAALRQRPAPTKANPTPSARAARAAIVAPAEPLRDSPAALPPRLASIYVETAPAASAARAVARRRLIRPTGQRARARFYGSVVDVLSLEPVSGARLQFVDLASGRRYNATTDWTGSYSVYLPPSSEGYALLFSRDGYGPQYAESDSEAIQATGEDARRRMAEEIASASRARNAFTALPGERRRYDFAVAPQRS